MHRHHQQEANPSIARAPETSDSGIWATIRGHAPRADTDLDGEARGNDTRTAQQRATGTVTEELTSHEPMTPRQQESREQNERVGVRKSGWDGVVDWGSSLVGGSPNVTGGCEKMGNWRSRSGQAILRECRAVGKIPSRVFQATWAACGCSVPGWSELAC